MWFVAVREIIDKVEEAEGAKHIGGFPDLIVLRVDYFLR